MIIASSVPTLLNEIIKQAKDIASEARWMEFYCHSKQDENQIGAIEDTVFCIEQALVEVKRNLEDLKSPEI